MRRDYRPLALITQVGVTMVVSIVLFLLLGLWIDNHFDTKPWFTLILTLVGMLVGSVSVYRMIADAIAAAAEKDDTGADKSDEYRKGRKENE